MLNFKRIAIISLMSLASVCAKAQFYQTGDDPAGIRWSHFKTPEFHLIYASGLDSLALGYASALEEWRVPVSRSIGIAPNGNYRRQMPVILHPLNALANGSVTWAPRRMDLYTLPDAYTPEPVPWIKTLAIHESRHVAQLQFVNNGRFKPGSYVFGEMWGGALSAIYGGPAFFEGDAVTAETALTRSGRGRSADFLEHQMVALDHGDWRDWYGWRYSSIKRYTPDHYRVGYMTVAGMRTLYDEPLFTERYYSHLQRHSSRIFNVMRKTTMEVSGKKPKESFREIEECFLADWRKGFEARGPFMPMDTVTATPRRYAEFTGITIGREGLYAIHRGLEHAPSVSRIGTDGEVRELRPFGSVTSDLRWSDALERLFWSENIPDRRWSLKSGSVIRCMDPEDGSIVTLTREGNLFHPAPEPGGTRISTTEYTMDARSHLTIIDARSGEVLDQFAAPDSLQIVESAWVGRDIYVSAISDGGYGIYKAGAFFSEVLSPLPVTIKQLRCNGDGTLMFVCDRTGVNEVYAMDVASGAVEQLSCTRYGIADFAFSEDGRDMYFSALAPEARYICRTETSLLPRRMVSFGDIHHHAIADKLSAQEETLARQEPHVMDSLKLSMEPRAWRKASHLLQLHSWLVPLSVDYDSIKDLSFESVQTSADLGATAFFQNSLGTCYGSAAYSLDLEDESGVRHGAHLKFNYSGLYPVIEASADFNENNAGQYQLYQIFQQDGSYTYARGMKRTSEPLVSGSLRIYVPLNFSSGGWMRGVVPQLRYSASNNMFSTSVRKVDMLPDLSGEELALFGGYVPGNNIMLHRLSATVRAYCMRPVAKAGVFPHLGVGAEVGLAGRMGLTDIFSPAAFCNLYGYLPGIIPQHGLRLAILAQKQLGDGYCFGEDYASTAPRGLSGISSLLSTAYPSQAKLTAEYKMAVAPVDWTWLGALAYIRNFEITGHCDVGAYAGSKAVSLAERGTAYSAGADFCAVLGNILWIPYDTRIGVSVSYNGGSLYDCLTATGAKTGRTYIGTTFSIDL